MFLLNQFLILTIYDILSANRSGPVNQILANISFWQAIIYK